MSTTPATRPLPDAGQLEALRAIERRVLWLATRIIDHANRERPAPDPLKVGGHQASSASMVSLMTALWFWDLRGADRVSVKPHASPVLHAIEYLQGRLGPEMLTTLRDMGGLQAYPSMTKDRFRVDYSTGSVGLGAAAPLFDALVEEYVLAHFGGEREGRFIALLGDAELDEGSLWEAIFEPAARGLDRALWIVDLNRQSLDRVVPVIRAGELERQFAAAGWRTVSLKYGRRLEEAFAAPGGELLRRQIDLMPNRVYQGLFGASEEVVHETVLAGLTGADRRRLAALLADHSPGLGSLVGDLGGHDLAAITEALAGLDGEGPAIIFAYTVKGHGLPIAGRRLNHSALLSAEQIDALRAEMGLDPETEWDRLDPESAEGRLCARAAQALERPAPPAAPPVAVPGQIIGRPPAETSTQGYLGRILTALGREPELAPRLVTVSPDVSVSTNLGGWINAVGVFGREPEPGEDDSDGQPVTWRVGPAGRHIELGISEMNLFMLLGQLGLSGARRGERLLPIGTVYDPFVCRGLDALIYGLYCDARFVVAGTPAGTTLSREGGAHQSTITPGIGMGLPNLTYAEPCYARELEWLLLDGLARLQEPEGESLYLRLSTLPVDQGPFEDLVAARGAEAVRAEVLAGGTWLAPAEPDEAWVVIAACGALVPEALAARELLAGEGVPAAVLLCSSPDLLWRGRAEGASHLSRLIGPAMRGALLVTVLDGASAALGALGSTLGMQTVALGVDAFGQAASLPDIRELFGLSGEAIAERALDALQEATIR